MASFTDDEIGKTVQTTDGEEVGQIVTVEGETAHVETDPGVLDSVRAALGMEGDEEGAVAVEDSQVDQVTDDTVYLSTEHVRGGPEEIGGGSAVEHEEGMEGVDRRETDTSIEPEEIGDEPGDDPTEREGDASDERHSEMDDAPPEGDRTVTEERGENEPERD